jgi:hypothetical protein
MDTRSRRYAPCRPHHGTLPWRGKRRRELVKVLKVLKVLNF